MILICGVLCHLLGTFPAHSPPDPPQGYSVEVQTRERWLHGRQRSRFTAFLDSRRWIRVDSVRAGSPEGERTLFLTLRGEYADVPARLVHGPGGRTLREEAVLPLSPRSRYQTSRDSANSVRSALMHGPPGRYSLSLPTERLWELVPTFHPGRLERGARWSDPVRRVAEREEFRQSLDGVRVSTLVKDTLVGGRRLWIVRDSARVHYAERWREEERTLDTLVTMQRSASGVIRGRYLYDPALRLHRALRDTTVLAGEAVLRYPDGRVFRTPARYERTRRWDLFDPAGFQLRTAALDSAWDAERAGMVIAPRNRTEERLARGSVAVRDSLVLAWQRARDPDERLRLLRVLEMWGPDGPEFRERLRRLSLEAGDTAYVVEQLRSRIVGTGHPVSDSQVRLLLPFMEDPGVAFAFGLARDPTYENFRQALLTEPPAITGDRTRWPCTPTACHLLALQWERAREPRLRDLGLIARLTLDPAGWSDTLLRRAAAGSVLLRPALLLVQGALPGPDADWRAWMQWVSGPDLRFGTRHATVMRFTAARTGRDVVGEIRRKMADATRDSARLVYGSILLGLGEHHPDPAAVAERFRSRSAADRDLAARELPVLFHSARPADPATTVALLDRMLAIALEGAEPWPALPVPMPPSTYGLHRIQEGDLPAFLVGDSLPAEVRRRWSTQVRVVSSAEIRSYPLRSPAIVFHTDEVVRAGPFVRIGLSYSTRMARREDQAPGGYAGGFAAYLMESGGDWVVVGQEGWVT